jgi:hypothetical protein
MPEGFDTPIWRRRLAFEYFISKSAGSFKILADGRYLDSPGHGVWRLP